MAKKVEMNQDKEVKEVNNPNQPQKLSYEQLTDICNQMNQEILKLRHALQEQSMENVYMRINYLFEVVKSNSEYFTSDFIHECAEELEKLIRVPKEEAVPEQEK